MVLRARTQASLLVRGATACSPRVPILLLVHAMATVVVAFAPRPVWSTEPRSGLPRVGVELDAGFPSGAVAAVVYRPVQLLRLDAGVSYNLIGFGLRGGATLVPWQLALAPVLRAELGHSFPADASGVVGDFTSLTTAQRRALSQLGFDYASVQLGVELGHPDRLIFFLRGGVSWLWATAGGVQAVAIEQDPRITRVADPSITGRTLSASAGVLFFFW